MVSIMPYVLCPLWGNFASRCPAAAWSSCFCSAGPAAIPTSHCTFLWLVHAICCSEIGSFAWAPGSRTCLRCVKGVPVECPGGNCGGDPPSPGEEALGCQCSVCVRLETAARGSSLRVAYAACLLQTGCSHGMQHCPSSLPRCAFCPCPAQHCAGSHIVTVARMTGCTLNGTYEVKAYTKCSSWSQATPPARVQFAFVVNGVRRRLCCKASCSVFSWPD